MFLDGELVRPMFLGPRLSSQQGHPQLSSTSELHSCHCMLRRYGLVTILFSLTKSIEFRKRSQNGSIVVETGVPCGELCTTKLDSQMAFLFRFLALEDNVSHQITRVYH